jgi:hypothetical protein
VIVGLNIRVNVLYNVQYIAARVHTTVVVSTPLCTVNLSMVAVADMVVLRLAAAELQHLVEPVVRLATADQQLLLLLLLLAAVDVEHIAGTCQTVDPSALLQLPLPSAASFVASSAASSVATSAASSLACPLMRKA